jgi:hypothetical protein
MAAESSLLVKFPIPIVESKGKNRMVEETSQSQTPFVK